MEIEISITDEDISKGVVASHTDCPAMLALNRQLPAQIPRVQARALPIKEVREGDGVHFCYRYEVPDADVFVAALVPVSMLGWMVDFDMRCPISARSWRLNFFRPTNPAILCSRERPKSDGT